MVSPKDMEKARKKTKSDAVVSAMKLYGGAKAKKILKTIGKPKTEKGACHGRS